MTPAFRIVVGGEDRTGVIADRLLMLTVTDEDGVKADRVEIELDDRDGRLAFPDIDAMVEISLGWKDAPLALMGIYAVDGISGDGPRQTMRITATAADLKGDIRAPRTRSWLGQSLTDIVATIAGEAGLTPIVGETLSGVRWDFLAQTAESNLHFLTRIAAGLDATCKPAGGALVVQRRGEGKTAAGDMLPSPTIYKSQVSDWSWSYNGRTVYRSAEAEWTDVATGITHKVRSGSGTPLKKIRHPFPSESEAMRAADSALSSAGRSEMELRVALSTFNPELLGGGLALISGLRSELNGEWHLKSVTHRFGGAGLVTEFQAERRSGQ